MKTTSILGLNSRGVLYTTRYNSRHAKRIADSKLQTDRVLRINDIPHPEIFAKFRNPNDVFGFDWKTLPDAFALKPSRGLGGEGIIVVKKRIKNLKSPDKEFWFTTQKTIVTEDDLKLHIMDILEGAYSMGNEPDVAFIQEYVGRHDVFRKFAFRGTPDIRIIVFNKIPVMAMLRLPTKESGGRANLHQGAIGVGVDIATGITTNAILGGNQILLKPGSNRKLRGIKVPKWNLVLTIAVNGQIASGLGYCGVDIVMHPEKGPLIIELNAQPGLQIQMANMEGLKKRLERVDEMEVRDAAHGVAIAKALFAGKFAGRVKSDETSIVIKAKEKITILSFDKTKSTEVEARVDTGAKRSSIDKKLAESLNLLSPKNILWKDRYEYRSATGLQSRMVVGVEYTLSGKRIKTSVSVADRSKMGNHFLIGRNDMVGFVVNPNIL